MSDSEADPSFSVLPARLRRRIDRAFDATAKQFGGHGDEPARKKQKIQGNNTPSSSVQHSAGGFIVDDAPAPGDFLVDDAPGGFVVDDAMDGGFIPESSSTTDDDETMNTPNRIDQIPLSRIPSALQLLDLQPDDADVLSVFRNAATGWENKHDSFAEKQDEAHLLVGRKDWRAVCAALMDVGAGDGEDQEDDHDDVEMGAEEDEPYGEEWVESDDASDFDEGDDSGDSDGEYVGDGSALSKSRIQKSTVVRQGKTRRRASSPLSPLVSSDDEDFAGKTRPITARQKAESRRTFALFFPDVPDTELDKKRVMIRDIARVAGLLKEKLTTEDIVEMLEAFSSSPDKSMSLRDFECMMVAAKLA